MIYGLTTQQWLLVPAVKLILLKCPIASLFHVTAYCSVLHSHELIISLPCISVPEAGLPSALTQARLVSISFQFAPLPAWSDAAQPIVTALSIVSFVKIGLLFYNQFQQRKVSIKESIIPEH